MQLNEQLNEQIVCHIYAILQIVNKNNFKKDNFEKNNVFVF